MLILLRRICNFCCRCAFHIYIRHSKFLQNVLLHLHRIQIVSYHFPKNSYDFMKSFTENKYVLLAFMVCIAAFFANNHVIKPDIMESRNIIAACEMVYDGHWLIPTMNGELRLEKPPLPTWITAVAEMISPDNIALQRGMAGMAALLLVLYFGLFAKRVLRVEPLIPTLLLCTCYNFILMGRTASWDIYCHAFMMGGISHLAIALKGQAVFWRDFLLSGVFTGLSLLSKGPVSLYALFLPFLVSYVCFTVLP